MDISLFSSGVKTRDKTDIKSSSEDIPLMGYDKLNKTAKNLHITQEQLRYSNTLIKQADDKLRKDIAEKEKHPDTVVFTTPLNVQYAVGNVSDLDGYISKYISIFAADVPPATPGDIDIKIPYVLKNLYNTSGALELKPYSSQSLAAFNYQIREAIQNSLKLKQKPIITLKGALQILGMTALSVGTGIPLIQLALRPEIFSQAAQIFPIIKTLYGLLKPHINITNIMNTYYITVPFIFKPDLSTLANLVKSPITMRYLYGVSRTLIAPFISSAFPMLGNIEFLSVFITQAGIMTVGDSLKYISENSGMLTEENTLERLQEESLRESSRAIVKRQEIIDRIDERIRSIKKGKIDKVEELKGMNDVKKNQEEKKKIIEDTVIKAIENPTYLDKLKNSAISGLSSIAKWAEQRRLFVGGVIIATVVSSYASYIYPICGSVLNMALGTASDEEFKDFVINRVLEMSDMTLPFLMSSNLKGASLQYAISLVKNRILPTLITSIVPFILSRIVHIRSVLNFVDRIASKSEIYTKLKDSVLKQLAMEVAWGASWNDILSRFGLIGFSAFSTAFANAGISDEVVGSILQNLNRKSILFLIKHSQEMILNTLMTPSVQDPLTLSSVINLFTSISQNYKDGTPIYYQKMEIGTLQKFSDTTTPAIQLELSSDFVENLQIIKEPLSDLSISDDITITQGTTKVRENQGVISTNGIFKGLKINTDKNTVQIPFHRSDILSALNSKYSLKSSSGEELGIYQNLNADSILLYSLIQEHTSLSDVAETSEDTILKSSIFKEYKKQLGSTIKDFSIAKESLIKTLDKLLTTKDKTSGVLNGLTDQLTLFKDFIETKNTDAIYVNTQAYMQRIAYDTTFEASTKEDRELLDLYRQGGDIINTENFGDRVYSIMEGYVGRVKKEYDILTKHISETKTEIQKLETNYDSLIKQVSEDIYLDTSVGGSVGNAYKKSIDNYRSKFALYDIQLKESVENIRETSSNIIIKHELINSHHREYREKINDRGYIKQNIINKNMEKITETYRVGLRSQQKLQRITQQNIELMTDIQTRFSDLMKFTESFELNMDLDLLLAFANIINDPDMMNNMIQNGLPQGFMDNLKNLLDRFNDHADLLKQMTTATEGTLFECMDPSLSLEQQSDGSMAPPKGKEKCFYEPFAVKLLRAFNGLTNVTSPLTLILKAVGLSGFGITLPLMLLQRVPYALGYIFERASKMTEGQTEKTLTNEFIDVLGSLHGAASGSPGQFAYFTTQDFFKVFNSIIDKNERDMFRDAFFSSKPTGMIENFVSYFSLFKNLLKTNELSKTVLFGGLNTSTVRVNYELFINSYENAHDETLSNLIYTSIKDALYSMTFGGK